MNKIILNYTDTENLKPDNVNYVFTCNPCIRTAITTKTFNKENFGLKK